MLVLLILSLVGTALTIYFGQYLPLGEVIFWTIPLYIIFYIFVAFLLFVLVLTVISLVVKPDREHPKQIYRKMIIFICKFLTGFYRIRYQLHGFEKIPKNTTFLLVANHQSNIDPIAMIWAFRDYHITYIMKDGLMKLPIVGRWLYGSGFFPINRKNNRKAAETIINASKRIGNGVHSVAVYPEGHRSKGPNMNEFRSGVFKIAQKAESSIVVCAIDNTYKVKKRFPFSPTTIIIEVVDVWEYDRFKDLNTIDLGNEIHKQIEDTLNKYRNIEK